MQAGIDLNALVIDAGSSSIKVGYSGAENPQLFYDSCIGYLESPINTQTTTPHSTTNTSSQLYFDRQLSIFHPQKEIQQTIQNGLIMDFERIEDIFASIFTHLHITPNQHPLLLSETLYNTKPRREKITEIIFESFRFPQFTMAHDVVLDAFSVGKPAGLVINLGAGKTTIAAVTDGHALLNSARYTKIGGDSLDVLLESLLTTTHNINSLPLAYQYNRDYNPLLGKISLTPNHLVGTTSYHSYQERQLLRDIKHTCLKIPFTPYNPDAGSNIECFYTLPDGNVINVGEIGCILGESLFTPIYKLGSEIITDFDDNNQHNKSSSYTSSKFQTLPLSIHSCIMDSDVDLRSMLLNNIILTGGNSTLSGLVQRLQIELSSILAGGFKLNITKQLTSFERQYGTWIGGSILTSLSSFTPRFIYRSEYEEFGMSILQRKLL